MTEAAELGETQNIDLPNINSFEGKPAEENSGNVTDQ